MIESGSPPALPTGIVTFLLTDLEGSTRLWEQAPDAMRTAMARHDALIEAAVAAGGGVVVRPRGEGDSRFAVFSDAPNALSSAAEMQRALYSEPWQTPSPLRIRIGLYTGQADVREGDYYGTAVNRCSRLRGAAHGGQTLVSETTYGLVGDSLPRGIALADLGEYRLRDVRQPERIYELVVQGLPAEFPPLRSLETFHTNLPSLLTSFIGREREMAEVKQALKQARLLTISGPGGAGKTRLALQVGADLVD
ncbi:MAG: adenylate/guanylate cyclase domain-containing protein, partial [Rudaea sp.]